MYNLSLIRTAQVLDPFAVSGFLPQKTVGSLEGRQNGEKSNSVHVDVLPKP